MRCENRFFYSDGLAVSKFEVVLSTIPRFVTNSSIELFPALQALVGTSARVRVSGTEFIERPLASAGDALARLLLDSSTMKKFTGERHSYWIRAGEPCVILTYGEEEPLRVPAFARSPPPLLSSGIVAHHWWHQSGNHGVRVWALKHGSSATLSDYRTLRILLGRIHTEYECLRIVLEEVGVGGETERGIRRDSEFFQFYLNEATRRLLRAKNRSQRFFDTRHGEVDLVAIHAFNQLNPGLREGITAKLDSLVTRKEVLSKTRAVINNYYSEVTMGDKFDVSGIAGAVGPNARAEGNTFNQYWNEGAGDADVSQLIAELGQLRETLKSRATSPEQDVAVAAVAQAEIAAKKGDRRSLLNHLSTAGKWVLDTAKEIGVTVAVSALKSALGVP
jgi:hypothetical protein